jgi:hypothetical protein
MPTPEATVTPLPTPEATPIPTPEAIITLIPSPPAQSVRLSTRDYFSSGQNRANAWRPFDELRMNTGDYTNDVLTSSARSWQTGYAFRDYLLNGEYSRINGTLFLSFGSRSTLSDNHLVILGDGVELYRSPAIRANSFPVAFDVDISDVVILRIQFEFGSGSASTIGISNTQLIR